MNTVQNGKGSKSRITNKKVFAANWDEINWGHCGKLKFDSNTMKKLEFINREVEESEESL